MHFKEETWKNEILKLNNDLLNDKLCRQSGPTTFLCVEFENWHFMSQNARKQLVCWLARYVCLNAKCKRSGLETYILQQDVRFLHGFKENSNSWNLDGQFEGNFSLRPWSLVNSVIITGLVRIPNKQHNARRSDKYEQRTELCCRIYGVCRATKWKRNLDDNKYNGK